MSDNAMKLLSERVRARVRRGASTRHSLLWWWLWEQRAQLEELIRAGEVSWAATAEVMAAIGLVGATGKPVEGGGLRKTWVRMLAEAPAEAARMAEAAKQRRHARARKVEGKISRARTPLAKAAEKHRQEQIAKAAQRREVREAMAAMAESWARENVRPIVQPAVPTPAPAEPVSASGSPWGLRRMVSTCSAASTLRSGSVSDRAIELD